MATTRASGYVVTAAVWNALHNKLTDDGNTYSGAFNGSSVTGTTGSFSSTLAVTGAATFSSTIKERGRTTPIGEWIAVSFDALNFFSGSGGIGHAWTVESGDVSTNRYTLIGKTLIWSLRVGASTLAASVTELRATIPGGFTANSSASVRAGYTNPDGTALSDVMAEAVSGTTYVRIVRDGGTAFANGTNTGYFYFEIAIEIQ